MQGLSTDPDPECEASVSSKQVLYDEGTVMQRFQSSVPFWPETSHFRRIFPACCFSRFLNSSFLCLTSHFSTILFHISGVSQPFLNYGIRAWACDSFVCGNTLDCLHFMQGLHSFVVSKCRKRHHRGTYLKIFLGRTCPRSPLKARAFGALGSSYATSNSSLFLVDSVGMSGNVSSVLHVYCMRR